MAGLGWGGVDGTAAMSAGGGAGLGGPGTGSGRGGGGGRGAGRVAVGGAVTVAPGGELVAAVGLAGRRTMATTSTAPTMLAAAAAIHSRRFGCCGGAVVPNVAAVAATAGRDAWVGRSNGAESVLGRTDGARGPESPALDGTGTEAAIGFSPETRLSGTS